jgi:hypothetical protein
MRVLRSSARADQFLIVLPNDISKRRVVCSDATVSVRPDIHPFGSKPYRWDPSLAFALLAAVTTVILSAAALRTILRLRMGLPNVPQQNGSWWGTVARSILLRRAVQEGTVWGVATGNVFRQ